MGSNTLHITVCNVATAHDNFWKLFIAWSYTVVTYCLLWMTISPSVLWCSMWSSPPPCAASCPSTLPSRPSHGDSHEIPSLREKDRWERVWSHSLWLEFMVVLWDRRATSCEVTGVWEMWLGAKPVVTVRKYIRAKTLACTVNISQSPPAAEGLSKWKYSLWLWRRIPLSLVRISEQIKETEGWVLDFKKGNCTSTCHHNVKISHYFVDSRCDWEKKDKHYCDRGKCDQIYFYIESQYLIANKVRYILLVFNNPHSVALIFMVLSLSTGNSLLSMCALLQQHLASLS